MTAVFLNIITAESPSLALLLYCLSRWIDMVASVGCLKQWNSLEHTESGSFTCGRGDGMNGHALEPSSFKKREKKNRKQ